MGISESEYRKLLANNPELGVIRDDGPAPALVELAAPGSPLAARFELLWRILDGPALEQEYRFHPTRKWRIDYYHAPTRTGLEKLLATLEGGAAAHAFASGQAAIASLASAHLAAGDGHPAEIMDMSFAIQALSAQYLAQNKGLPEGKPILADVPQEIDEKVALLKLKFWGLSIDRLTPEQEAYINSYNV